jgi:Na+/H+ antiporter NhaA
VLVVGDDVLAVVVVALLGSTACRSIRTVLLLVAGHRPAVLIVLRRVEDDGDGAAL